jgi:hypothetical protein
MLDDHSGPENPVPDFPGLDSVGSADGPQVHTEETLEHPTHQVTYRDFLVSGCRPQVDAARKVVQVVGTGDPDNRLKAFDSCRTVAWFVRHTVSGKIRVASSRCGNRWCPLCIKTKRFAIVQSVTAWMAKVVQPKFMTLTLKHTGSPLSDQITALYKFFKELKRRPWFKKRVFGGVWFFQVKVSKADGMFHPHIHILFQGRFIDHEKICQIWKQITHGSDIVDIRAVKNPKKAAEYVARYASAPCDITKETEEKAIEIATALHGRRICGSWGLAKSVKFAPGKPDDADQWQRLGSFSQITEGSKWNDIDSEIVKCWKDGTMCRIIPPDMPKPPPEIEKTTPDDVTEYTQMLLEFYER